MGVKFTNFILRAGKAVLNLLRVLFFSVIIGVLLICLLGLLAWETDFYTTRDRIEHYKQAMFSHWTGRNWCPPGRRTLRCDRINILRDWFLQIDHFKVFKSVPIDGTGLNVITGISFSDVNEVVEAKPNYYWCYIFIGSGNTAQQIILGEQSAQETPEYTDLTTLSPDVVQTLNNSELSIEQLQQFSLSHCRLGLFHRHHPDDFKFDS